MVENQIDRSELNEETIGNRIKSLRVRFGYTKQQVSDILKISIRTYYNLEADIKNPNVDELGALSKLFKCSTDYIIFGKRHIKE